MKRSLFFILIVCFLSSCNFEDVFDPFGIFGGNNGEGDPIREIGGNPSPGSQTIYASASLDDMCVDDTICGPPYEVIADTYRDVGNQEELTSDVCDFDYDANAISTFVLNSVDAEVNGLELLLSKEDLFFIAWTSVRFKINPYFLMGVLSAESSGNCAAVSSSNGEGCFQITNTFGQAQLNDSYPNRVSGWFWTDRDSDYYEDDLFVDQESYFGEIPSSDQFRLTLDPSQHDIDGTDVSSVVNFPHGVIASGLYFYWQQYLLFNTYNFVEDNAVDLFQSDDGKALWQAAAYNGGAYGAANALEVYGSDFLDHMHDETQTYAPRVVDYCKEYQGGEATYSASYTEDDVEWLIDLLSYTYPDDSDIDWDAVKQDVHDVFFEDGTEALTFVDDVKALIYVISTHVPELAPEWPDSGSI
ncbi:hypothetical protein K1X76_05920 [bacterium]|nr:hypothetical protein [bacterium]